MDRSVKKRTVTLGGFVSRFGDQYAVGDFLIMDDSSPPRFAAHPRQVAEAGNRSAIVPRLKVPERKRRLLPPIDSQHDRRLWCRISKQRFIDRHVGFTREWWVDLHDTLSWYTL